jgi:Uma2 family endonuclease
MLRAVRQVRFSKLTLDQHVGRGDRAEFVAGERFPLPEESRAHRLVAQNFFLAVARHLDGGTLSPHLGLKPVRIDAADALYYPDLVVVDGDDAPQLVIEVMAPETAPTDAREKWLCYQLLDTIREVVLVGLDPREVEVRRRGWDGAWSGEVYDRGEMAWLEAIGLALAVDAIYAGIDGLTVA